MLKRGNWLDIAVLLGIILVFLCLVLYAQQPSDTIPRPSRSPYSLTVEEARKDPEVKRMIKEAEAANLSILLLIGYIYTEDSTGKCGEPLYQQDCVAGANGERLIETEALYLFLKDPRVGKVKIVRIKTPAGLNVIVFVAPGFVKDLKLERFFKQ